MWGAGGLNVRLSREDPGCRVWFPPLRRFTVKVMGRWSARTVDVAADGTGLCSRAGTVLLALVADRVGLTGGLCDALAGTRERRGGHAPGRVFSDLAVMLADGGRCLSDLAALAGQSSLFGEVASVSTARRVMLSIGESELVGIRAARAAARARAWEAGAAPERVILDFDATPIDVHSEMEQAAGHYKGGFGFNPLLVSCGREVLAGVLRPGNAGANNADDHLRLLDLALEQLPASALDGEILARSDSAGASHDLADACRETEIRFSFGYPLTEPVRQALDRVEESAWRPAIGPDGEDRDGAWVSELTGQVNLSDWPEGTRLICRRERPHPGAQLAFTDLDGHRFQCFITDQTDPDIAALEVLHRQHAQVEDRIKTVKTTGASHLPFHAFAANAAWLELALAAHDVMVWTQLLTLDSEHQICEPKRLRYRILHVAGQLTRHARRITLHLPADWPWAGAILRAFKRLQALQAHG